MKRYKNHIRLLAVFYILLSCSPSKSVGSASNNWSIEINKGGCLDVCSSYSILIRQDGSYAYKGQYKAPHLGTKSGSISPQLIDDLKTHLDAINFTTLDSFYGNPANDSQRKELQYTTQKINKKIVYFRLEPQEIRDLEHFIDQLIQHEDF